LSAIQNSVTALSACSRNGIWLANQLTLFSACYAASLNAQTNNCSTNTRPNPYGNRYAASDYYNDSSYRANLNT
jgi:hypothetical protein